MSKRLSRKFLRERVLLLTIVLLAWLGSAAPFAEVPPVFGA